MEVCWGILEINAPGMPFLPASNREGNANILVLTLLSHGKKAHNYLPPEYL